MFKSFFLYVVITVFSLQLVAQSTEQKLVQNSFDVYKNHLINDNGIEAIKCLDSNTINYYNDLYFHVIYSDSITLDTLSMIDKLNVLLTRQRLEKEELFVLNGEKLIIFAINNNLGGKDNFSKMEILKVKIEKDLAESVLSFNKIEIPGSFYFKKENGIWKINLTMMFEKMNKPMEVLKNQFEQTENSYLLNMVEKGSRKKVKDDIWKPILSK